MSQTQPSVFQLIASVLAEWRRRQLDRRQMMAMSEAELRDLGIGRGQISALLESVPSRGASWPAGSGPTLRAKQTALEERAA
ncbi:MAG: DUF1127 domain-containing protein [Proteobacteria bacterium]|nr:DUF1127 domain-containing protein [Pseudomonadota bacterium]